MEDCRQPHQWYWLKILLEVCSQVSKVSEGTSLQKIQLGGDLETKETYKRVNFGSLVGKTMKQVRKVTKENDNDGILFNSIQGERWILSHERD